jgi:deoxyribose-phosphate aldolase
MDFLDPYTYTNKQLEDRLYVILSQQEVKAERNPVLRRIIGFIDLTTLEGTDNLKRINDLCEEALRISGKNPTIPPPAAVCVYPPFVRQAKHNLEGSQIRVACAAGGFPSGQLPLRLKLEEISYALDEGADEIDMVFSRGKLMEGNDREVFEEISAVRERCSGSILKVILETGELGSVHWIRLASEIAILAGADFIKTSTGKIQPAAAPLPFLIMLETIKEYYIKTGKRTGIKAAGGIGHPDQALIYYRMVDQLLGEEWLHPGLFRIGASRLVNSIIEDLG